MIYSSLSCDELVRACAEPGNTEAWQEFVCRFGQLINLMVLRVARRYGENSSALIEDLVQDTYLKVCANHCSLLRNFAPQHQDAFYGMISVTAANVARDYFRSRYSGKRGSGRADVELLEAGAFNFHATDSDELDRRIMDRQIDEIDEILKANCDPRDREIFWFHHHYGFTAREIAVLRHYRLTIKGVESILHRLKCLVCEKYASQ